MIWGFHGTAYQFRSAAPGLEALRLLARLDRVQAFRHFVARHAPAEFIPLFRDFEQILHGMIRGHVDGWQVYEDPGRELAEILELRRGRFRHHHLGPAQIEQEKRDEAIVMRMIELWQAFAEVKP